MHEFSLIRDLIHKIQLISRDQNGAKVSRVKVKLGALSPISAEHFREHFEEGTRGTVAQGARLEVEVAEDEGDRHAQEILLKSVDIEDTI